MNRISIDLDRAVALIIGIVGRFGKDHTAQKSDGSVGCVYGEADKNGALTPLCIVGVLFSDLGILRATVSDYPDAVDWHGACGVGADLWSNAEAMGVTFTEEAQEFLRYAQREQDSGHSWGEALTRAVTASKEAAIERLARYSRLAADVSLALNPMQPWEVELLGQ